MPARPPTPAPRARRSPPALGLALAFSGALAAGACADDTPTAPRPGPASQSAAAAAPPLTWLAPLGTGSADPATFDATAAPAVEVCAWVGAACDGPPVARFTTAPAAGELPLTVNASAGRYEAEWSLTDARFTGRRTYRLRVLQGATELGALSVDAVRGRWALTRDDGTLAPLTAAGTLPIRFHLARGTPAGVDSLPGEPGSPVGPAIPDLTFRARAADYSTTHPDLPGLPLSFNTLALVFAPGTTVGQANGVLADLGAAIVGGIAGTSSTPGILYLRAPTTTHEQMIALLARLRANPLVRTAVQDALLSLDVVTRPGGGIPSAEGDWDWGLTPDGGNWGLELARAPQTWNLNPAICKALGVLPPACTAPDPAALPGGPPEVGVLDAGFVSGHPDLTYVLNQTAGATPLQNDFHGTLVAGIIGARFGNGIGVDGIDPFARLVVRKVDYQTVALPAGGSALDYVAASLLLTIQEYKALITSRPDVQILNISQGYNWRERTGLDPSASPAAESLATQQGLLVAQWHVEAVRRGLRLPAVFVSAGNDYGFETRWNSPWTSAALVHGEATITAVEALTRAPGSTGGATRATYSNRDGQLSAPGTAVLSTSTTHCDAYDASNACVTLHPGDYTRDNGTSFAAPHAAGLAAYLYTVARLYGPSVDLGRALTRTTNPVRDLMLRDAVRVAGTTAPRPDAFSAALGLDVVLGGDRVLHGLLDVDDGTPDGDQRTNPDGSDYTEEDADNDRGAGDGDVDMSDFRRWRDWLLAAENAPGLALDGSDRHPKKDVNGNRRWPADGDDENVYPRGDFNGDGVLSRVDRQPVAGVMAGANATDLEVFQRLFRDRSGYYTAADLPARLESSDFAIDVSECFRVLGAARVRTRLFENGGAFPAPRDVSSGAAERVLVYTEPLSDRGHTVLIEVTNASGTIVARDDTTFGSTGLGSDTPWAPTCGAGNVFVRGGANPWLAGAPDGRTASRGQDRAPEQSPVDAKLRPFIRVGNVFTFQATGISFFGPGLGFRRYPNGIHPDGLGLTGPRINHVDGPEHGISDIFARPGALVGVFLGPEDPALTDAPAPAPVSETDPIVSPQLKQVFYIGPGCLADFVRTGCVNTGTEKQFRVPPGATRLYLGIMDGIGWYDNAGGFSVTVRATGARAGLVTAGVRRPRP